MLSKILLRQEKIIEEQIGEALNMIHGPERKLKIKYLKGEMDKLYELEEAVDNFLFS